MLPSRLPRPIRLGLYATAVTILLLMCILPTRDLPPAGPDDKLDHTIAWLVLTVTGYTLAPRRVWTIPVFAALFGILVEVLQGVLPFGRDAEFGDWLADLRGVAIGVVLFLLVRWMARARARV